MSIPEVYDGSDAAAKLLVLRCKSDNVKLIIAFQHECHGSDMLLSAFLPSKHAFIISHIYHHEA